MRVIGEAGIQLSDEWFKLREGKRTASTTPIIMEKSPFKTKKTYAEELIGLKKPYFNKAMQQGNDFEEQIRILANDAFNEHFEPAVFLDGDYLASLDGINFDEDFAIEIKLSKTTFDSVKKGICPEHYFLQIQHQYKSVPTLERIYLVAAYLDEEESEIKDMCHMLVERDDKVIEEIGKAWDDWDKYFENFDPTEDERTDKDWKEAAKSFIEADKQIKLQTEVMDAAKAILDNLSNGHKSRGSGVQTFYKSASSTVDYKAIYEDNKELLKDVDTEDFKKDRKGSFTVKAI